MSNDFRSAVGNLRFTVVI